MDEWIKLSDCWPPEGEEVLLYEDGEQATGHWYPGYKGKGRHWTTRAASGYEWDFALYEPTHWKPLGPGPDAPPS